MKKIPYVVKKVNNIGTIYHQISQSDRAFVLRQCQEVVDLFDILCKETDGMSMGVVESLTNPNSKMPSLSREYGGGFNSAYSMCKGTIENFDKGQYDLSYKTMPGVQEAFRSACANFSLRLTPDSYTLEEVDFYEVSELPKAVSPKQVVSDNSQSTFSDLFEVVMVTQPVFEIRRKV